MARAMGSKDKKPRKPKKDTVFKKGNTYGRGTPKTQSVPHTLINVSNKKIDKGLVDRYLTVNSHLTVAELCIKLRMPNVSVLEGMLIKGMLKAYRTGDPYNINFFLDRLIGRVPTHIAHSLERELEGLSDEELIAKKRKHAAALEREVAEVAARPLNVKKLEAFEKEKFREDEDSEEVKTPREIIDAERT